MEKKENKPALDMIEDYLKSNGYDGLKDIDESVLVDPDCRCFIDVGEDYPQHMRNCCGIERTCVAGYRCLNDDGEEDISLEKPETTIDKLYGLISYVRNGTFKMDLDFHNGVPIVDLQCKYQAFLQEIIDLIVNIIKIEEKQ